ncbi:RES domain-containing protein [Salmonella enterica subsp. enterica]|nr:RES domain-containing protein [Salmonella enterica subsp. enterica]
MKYQDELERFYNRKLLKYGILTMKDLLPLHEVNNLAKQILETNDAECLHPLINTVRKNLAIITSQYSIDIPLWRARKCNDTQIGFESIDDIMQPPAKITPNSRLNNAGEPILYLSTGPHAVLSETHANIGDIFHIVGFKFREHKSIKCASIGEISRYYKWQDSTSSEVLDRLIADTNPRDIDSLIFTDTFLASLLSDRNAKNNDYVHTRILADLLFQNNEIEAITYPGVESEQQKSFAIKPEVIDDTFEIANTFVIQVTEKYLCGMYGFETIRRAKYIDMKNRIIIWE